MKTGSNPGLSRTIFVTPEPVPDSSFLWFRSRSRSRLQRPESCRVSRLKNQTAFRRKLLHSDRRIFVGSIGSNSDPSRIWFWVNGSRFISWKMIFMPKPSISSSCFLDSSVVASRFFYSQDQSFIF